MPVLVDFTAPWCRPCRAIEPILDELAAEHEGRLRLVRLDVDANLRTPSRYGVLSLPTVIVFVAGEPRRDDLRRPAPQALRGVGRSGPRRRVSADAAWDAGPRRRRGRLPRHAARADGTSARRSPRARAHGRGAARLPRRDGPLRPPGRDLGGRRGGTERRRLHGDRVGEVARVLAAGPRRRRARAGDPRDLPLPDEGPRPGPGALAREPRRAGPAARDLRRRHPGRAARPHPADGQRDPHEPGHAPHRRPAPPRPVGRRAPQPPARRRRRGARLPGDLRLARRERPAPAPAAGARLRRRPGLRARLGDDRERGRARDPAHRPGRAGRRGRLVAPGRARGRALEPRAPRPRPRHARERARRRVAAARRARRPRPPHDLLHEEPQGGGARPPVRERPARPGDGPAARALPGRLHARAATRDRAAPRRGRAARRDVDRRARARDRHRLARLLDLGRLPGDGRVAPAAVGAGGTADARARRADRERGRARPVLRVRAAGAPRAHARRPR